MPSSLGEVVLKGVCDYSNLILEPHQVWDVTDHAATTKYVYIFPCIQTSLDLSKRVGEADT